MILHWIVVYSNMLSNIGILFSSFFQTSSSNTIYQKSIFVLAF